MLTDKGLGTEGIKNELIYYVVTVSLATHVESEVESVLGCL